VVGDPLPYGIEPNRLAIEKLIHYSHLQGLVPHGLMVDELFLDPR
jgi:hypothetical protein